MSIYTAFLLPPAIRQALLERFPPRYPTVKADHITHAFGAQDLGNIFHPDRIEITGVADDGNGLQTLVVRVNGEQYRPDGNPYHITWSLDPARNTPDIFGKSEPYESAHSNKLVRLALDKPGAPYTINHILPLSITANPALVCGKPDGGKDITLLAPPASFHPIPLSP